MFRAFFQKNLRISKKKCTFAADFEKKQLHFALIPSTPGRKSGGKVPTLEGRCVLNNG